MSTISRAYTRRYGDSGQLMAYAEWSDGGRTEGPAKRPLVPAGLHMTALFDRAKREGLTVAHEEWPA
jgi:hypothetical protein